MDLISAAAEQNRDEALARAMHDTKSMQACRTKVNLPSAEKCEVDGGDETNAGGPRKRNSTVWCDTGLVEAEVAKYLYADLWAGAGDAGEAKDGEKGGGGCCEIL